MARSLPLPECFEPWRGRLP